MPVRLKTDTDLWLTAGELLKATPKLRPMNFHQHTMPGDALDNERTGLFDKVMFTPVCNISWMVHHSWFVVKPWRPWWKGDLTQCSSQLEHPPLTCGSSLQGEPENVEIILYLTTQCFVLQRPQGALQMSCTHHFCRHYCSWASTVSAHVCEKKESVRWVEKGSS